MALLNLGNKALRLRWLFPVLARLPMPLAYRLAGAVGRLDARRQPELAASLCAAVDRVLPGQVRGGVEDYFAMLAMETLDACFLPRMTAANVRDWVRLEGVEHLEAAQGEGRGVILVMAHYGRLILTMVAIALSGHPLGMLTMAVDESNPGLDPDERRFLARKVGNVRRLLGGRWVSLGGPLRDLYRGLEAGEAITILLDAYMPSFGTRIGVPFMGGSLLVPQGVERLARKTGARMVYGVAVTEGHRVRASLRPLPDGAEAGLRAAVAELERDVRAHPWHWWQWNILDLVWQR